MFESETDTGSNSCDSNKEGDVGNNVNRWLESKSWNYLCFFIHIYVFTEIWSYIIIMFFN